MTELPSAWRTLLVESLDDYCETLDETADADEIAEAVIEQVESISEEVTGVESDVILRQLNESLDEDEADDLAIALADRLRAGLRPSGERLVQAIERLCEIEYVQDDEDEETAGFFGTRSALDEEF